jgi:hypothetical protein
MTKRINNDAEFGLIMGDKLISQTMPALFVANAMQLCFEVYETASIKMLHDLLRSSPRNVPKGEVFEGKTVANSEIDKSACFLGGRGFSYIFREENDSNAYVGKAFLDALEILNARAIKDIDAYTSNLGDDENAKLDTLDKKGFQEAIASAVPSAKSLKDMDEFFFSTLLNMHDDVRNLLELTVANFLFGLLSDTELFPHSSDGTEMTLRAKYAIELDSRLMSRIDALLPKQEAVNAFDKP